MNRARIVFPSSPNKEFDHLEVLFVIQRERKVVSIDTLQKASLTALVWFVCFFFTWSVIFRVVWPPERKIAAMRALRYPIDAPPPLPPWAWFALFAIPTAVIALMIAVYRSRTSRPGTRASSSR
jgi:hypothetical protein